MEINPARNPTTGNTWELASELQSKGRGEDTMLVHMTPNEVNSLQGLAMAHGGSLTINPQTGLPEAGWLGKLLPTILGVAGAAVGLPTWAVGLGVGAGQTALTGDLSSGLMAGLQAFGSASAARGFGLGAKAPITPPVPAAGAVPAAPAATVPTSFAPELAGAPGMSLPGVTAPINAAGSAVVNPASIVPGAGLPAAKPGLFSRFVSASQEGLPKGILTKAAPYAAGIGLLSTGSGAGGGMRTSDGRVDNAYAGPYYSQRRTATFAPSTEDLLSSTAERDYFDVDIPEVYNVSGQIVQPGSSTAPGTPILQNFLNPTGKKYKNLPMYNQQYVPFMGNQGMGYNQGGEVDLAPGGFVVDARTVSEAGNGYTDAGQKKFAALGGIPLKGPGDGVSDSINARIGKQPARVAAGEVYMPPEAVKRVGGAKKLYAMMDRAHQATKRGQKRDIVKV